MNYIDFATRTAVEAGAILKENLGKVSEIEFKGKNNLLTEIDKLSEETIIRRIRDTFPSHDILAEESGRHSQSSDHVWIVDPLDGTTNYAHAYPFFAVSIALEIAGVIKAGVVYDPVKDEMFAAEQGGGAFLNGKSICVSDSTEISEGHLATGFVHESSEMVEENLKHFANFIRKSRAVRRDGSAALDLCYVACGRFDGFWELGLNPWDTAAGVLIIREAGGLVTNLSGGEYDLYVKEILASNTHIHGEMINVLAIAE